MRITDPRRNREVAMSLRLRTRIAATLRRARRSPVGRSAIAIAIGLNVGLVSWLAPDGPALALGQPFDCLDNFGLFPLFCRGPLAYQLDTGHIGAKTYSFGFNRNPTGVGAAGTSSPLALGSCAFADRAVSSSEPDTLQGTIDLELDKSGSIVVIDPIYTAITQCNATPTSCVFQICIQSNNGQVFAVLAGEGAILSIPAPN
jgi:hypothetical protein